MKEIILIVAEIINIMHDIILNLTVFAGLDVTDKDLHLWIMGLIGIFIFGCTHVFFKYLLSMESRRFPLFILLQLWWLLFLPSRSSNK